MSNRQIYKALSCMMLFFIFAESAANAENSYVLAQQWELGPGSRWDYANVDPVRHRLFLSRGDHVQVVSLPAGAVLGNIENTMGVHGIVFAQNLKLGFTSNGLNNSVSIFDMDTLQVKNEVKINGINPDAILYEPIHRKIYTFNAKSSNATIMDAVDFHIDGNIDLSGRPEFAVVDDDGKIYVNIVDKSEIDVIDIDSSQVIARWPLAGCERPSGLSIDKENFRIFSVCRNAVMIVLDSRNGRHVADIPIGLKPDAAYYDAPSKTVFSSNGEGSLTIIQQSDSDHYRPTVLHTQNGARTMAFDSETKTIYLPTEINSIFTVLVVSRK